MKTIKITLKDNELHVNTQNVTLQEFTNMLMSAQLNAMTQTLNNAPTDQQPQVKEFLFDDFNQAASALLAQFAPDIDLRPDLQEEAILQAEDELLNRRLNHKA